MNALSYAFVPRRQIKPDNEKDAINEEKERLKLAKLINLPVAPTEMSSIPKKYVDIEKLKRARHFSRSPSPKHQKRTRQKLSGDWLKDVLESRFVLRMDEIKNTYDYVFPFYIDMKLLDDKVDLSFSNVLSCDTKFHEGYKPHTYDISLLLFENRVIGLEDCDKFLRNPIKEVDNDILTFEGNFIDPESHRTLCLLFENSSLVLTSIDLFINKDGLPVHNNTINHKISLLFYRKNLDDKWLFCVLDPNYRDDAPIGYLEKYVRFLNPFMRKILHFFINENPMRPLRLNKTVWFEMGLPTNLCAEINLIDTINGICFLNLCVIVIYMFGCQFGRAPPKNGKAAVLDFLDISKTLLESGEGDGDIYTRKQNLMSMIVQHLVLGLNKSGLHPLCRTTRLKRYHHKSFAQA